jgi:hypothetical protein
MILISLSKFIILIFSFFISEDQNIWICTAFKQTFIIMMNSHNRAAISFIRLKFTTKCPIFSAYYSSTSKGINYTKYHIFKLLSMTMTWLIEYNSR